MLDIVVQNLYSQKYKYWLLMCNLGSLFLLFCIKWSKQLLHRICSVKSQTVETVNFIKHLSVCSIWTRCLFIFSLFSAEIAFYWHACIIAETTAIVYHTVTQTETVLRKSIHPSIHVVLSDHQMYFHSIASRRHCSTTDYSTAGCRSVHTSC